MDRLFKSEKFSRRLVIAGFIIIVISIILFIIHREWNTTSQVDTGLLEQFGGFIAGTVGSLWALAGVILFYIALTEQREDFKTNRENLELQRQELKLNTEELKAQRIEFEKQNETLTKQHEALTLQQFENTFFSLLKATNEIKETFEISEGPHIFRSHQFFTYLKMQLFNHYEHIPKILSEYKSYEENKIGGIDSFIKNNITSYNIENIEELKKPEIQARAAYAKLFNNYHSQLGHYFRSLYHTIKFVSYHEYWELGHNSVTTKDEYARRAKDDNTRNKYRKYANYLQAQMSSSELLLLYYNALFFQKMRRWVYHYQLVENLSKEDLLNPADNLLFYMGEEFEKTNYKAIELKSRKEILKP